MNEDVEDRFKATKVVKLNSILVTMLSNLQSITKNAQQALHILSFYVIIFFHKIQQLHALKLIAKLINYLRRCVCKKKYL